MSAFWKAIDWWIKLKKRMKWYLISFFICCYIMCFANFHNTFYAQCIMYIVSHSQFSMSHSSLNFSSCTYIMYIRDIRLSSTWLLNTQKTCYNKAIVRDTHDMCVCVKNASDYVHFMHWISDGISSFIFVFYDYVFIL